MATSGRRSLGGGRILGSGQGISPAAATRTASPLQQQVGGSPTPQKHDGVSVHKRNASLLSPSESSASSQTSTPPSTLEVQDIGSQVSLGVADSQSAAAAAASSKLVCPICNEEMVSRLVFM
jgi:rabenosyn-5